MAETEIPNKSEPVAPSTITTDTVISTTTQQPTLPGGVIVPPPRINITDFPGIFAVVATVIGTTILLLVASRFDKTGGTLTISLLITLMVIGVIALSVLVTVPRDETTAALIGALVAGFGGVITYWLKLHGEDENKPPK
jgi:hypothetical protein